MTTKKTAPAGENPEEKICRCDWPDAACRIMRASCGRTDPGVRTLRQIEPWRFEPKPRRSTPKSKRRQGR